MAAAARALGTSPQKLKKLIDTFKDHGFVGVRSINLKPRKNGRMKNLTLEQMDIICNRDTLIQQSQMTLLERAHYFNQKWHAQGISLNAKDITKIYKGWGVTLQRYTSELGSPKRDA